MSNETPQYSHRQHGHVIRWAATAVAAVTALIIYLVAPEASAVALVVVVVAMAISFVFGSMTVEINGGQLNWWFGPSILKKSLAVADIAVAEQVRNNWKWGWGIRYYGNGWLFNVSGLDAVEVTRADGKMLRLGTDDPEGLAAAIHKATGDRSKPAG